MLMSPVKQRLLSEIHYFFGNPKDATFKIKYHKSFSRNFQKILSFQKICRERMWTTIHYHYIFNDYWRKELDTEWVNP